MRLSRVGVVADHVLAAAIIGFVLGFVYFAIEAYFPHMGRHEYLGPSLLQILAIYLLVGLLLGSICSIVIEVVCAFGGRRPKPSRYVTVYTVGFAAIFAAVYVVRDYTIPELKVMPGILRLGLLTLGSVCAVVLAFIASNWFDRRGLLRQIRSTAVAIIAACCLFVLGAVLWLADYSENHISPPVTETSADAPNIVLIVLDALRWDHLGSYGYDRNTSPNIDRLAKEGVLFREARSQGNKTVIAMPSLFTSVYPTFHGVIDRNKLMRPLSSEYTTIAELLRDNGYTTIGLMNNIYLKRQFGLVRGFDKVEEYNFGRFNLGLFRVLRRLGLIESPRYVVNKYPDADEVADVAIRWLRRLNEHPYFMYVHLMDTHHPYAPPNPYDIEFGNKNLDPPPLDLYYRTTYMIRHGPSVELEEFELAKLVDYYDGSIKFADHEIGRLLAEIEGRDSGRETIVIVTADHGDEFLEHGSLYHTNLVIEELIRVPLIVWSPERYARGISIDSMVRHIDLLPTIAEIADTEIPEQAMGRSLLPILEGKQDTLDVWSFAEGDFCVSLNHRDWKIMHVDSTDSFYLFNLKDTPCESEDLSASYPRVYSEMKQRLLTYIENARKVKKARMDEADEETIRQLKALGYL